MLRLAVAVLFLLAVGIIVWKTTDKQSSVIENLKRETPSESNIRFFKDSTVPEDMRSLTSAYISQGRYDEAAANAKKTAETTQNAADYISLLNICAIYNVKNKQACIDEAHSKVVSDLGSVSFYNAYSTAKVLDMAGQKKAADFYQRAYDTYDAKRAAADEGTMTKEQIKGRIDELRK